MTDELVPPPGLFDDDDYVPEPSDDVVVSIDRERARRNIPSGPASGWEAELVYETKGRGDSKESVLAPTAGNLNLLLQNDPAWKGCLGYNEFGEREVWLRTPPRIAGVTGPRVGEVRDEHDVYVQHWWHAKRQVLVQGVTSAVMTAARSNTFHPVRSYLEGLSWDAKPRLDTWLHRYFGVEQTPYSKAVGVMWAISAVARIMRPGEKVDTMLILEGEQGTGKSSGLAALVPEPDWYSDTPIDLRHKQDAFQVLQGKWIYEIGELHSFRGQDATRIKNFLSASSDNYRASYGKRNRTYPRHCVFAGTTNEKQYLTDRSGNRRFWPVECGKVDVPAIRADRDQLWAEAVARFASNEPWHITDAAMAALVVEQQEARLMPEDPWTDLIVKWLVHPTVPVEGSQSERSIVDLESGFTTNDVLLGAIGVKRDQLDRSRATRIGPILQALGYDSRQVRIPGTSERVRRYFKVH